MCCLIHVHWILGWFKAEEIAFVKVDSDVDGVLVVSRCVVLDHDMCWHVQVTFCKKCQ